MTSGKTYAFGELVSRHEAEAIYAERDARKSDMGGAARERARKAIGRADLPSPDGGKSFLAEEFFGWAKELNLKLPAGAAWVGKFAKTPWRERFAGYPAVIRIQGECNLAITAEAKLCVTRGVPTPECSAPAEWHEALATANMAWAEDQKRVMELEAELAQLRRDAAAKSDLRERRREYGRMGGRPKSTDN